MAAVLGFLNFLSDNTSDPISHAWGVSVLLVDPEERLMIGSFHLYGLVLIWHNVSPCRRRLTAPSWSSLAADGKVVYRVKSDNSIRGLFTGTCSVSISHSYDGTFCSLDQYVRTGQILRDSGRANAPRFLRLTDVPICPLEPYRPNFLILRVKNQHLLYLGLYWDLDNADEPDDNLDGSTFDSSMKMIVLQSKGTHFERIGAFKWRRSQTLSVSDHSTKIHQYTWNHETPGKFPIERRGEFVIA